LLKSEGPFVAKDSIAFSELSSTRSVIRWPNGLAFSCRERAADHLQKPNDLAREAVNCNHPSDTPYVSTAETALTAASSATISLRQS
jgi:hypothetical protein